MKTKVESWLEIAAKCNVSRSTILAHKGKPGAPKTKKALAWITYFQEHAKKNHSSEKSELQRQKLQKEIELLTYRGNIERRADELSDAEHKVKMNRFYTAEDMITLAKLLVDVLNSGVRIVETITNDPHCSKAVATEFDRLRNELRKAIKERTDASPMLRT